MMTDGLVLLNCPGCGLSHVEATVDYGDWRIECGYKKCNILGPPALTPEDAGRKWNLLPRQGGVLPDDADDSEPVHRWFSLSYAQFLTLPRLVMQSMPVAWQVRMVRLLRELDDTFDWRPEDGSYWVSLRDDKGRHLPMPDGICDYRHGSVEHLRKKNEKT